MKKFVLIIAICTLFFSPIAADYIYAQESTGDAMIEEKMEDDAEMVEEAMDSHSNKSELSTYELFWPVVAGKTRGDSLYSLKRLKEKLLGLLVFGEAKKTGYNLDLATKRILEADELSSRDDSGNAIKSLSEAVENIKEASEKWSEVEQPEQYLVQINEMNNRLENMQIFLNGKISDTDGELKQTYEQLLTEVANLDGNI